MTKIDKSLSKIHEVMTWLSYFSYTSILFPTIHPYLSHIPTEAEMVDMIASSLDMDKAFFKALQAFSIHFTKSRI